MLKSFPCQGLRSSVTTGVWSSKQEEKVSLSLPGFDNDDEDIDHDDDKISEEKVGLTLKTDAIC